MSTGVLKAGSWWLCYEVWLSFVSRKEIYGMTSTFENDMRSFAQEKKSQQAPEIDALVRDRKVFAWCHTIN